MASFYEDEWVSTGCGTTLAYKYAWSRTENRTADYYAKLKAKEYIPFTNHTFNLSKIDANIGAWWTYKPSYQLWFGPYTGGVSSCGFAHNPPFYPYGQFDQVGLDRANNRALENLSMGDFLMGVALLELGDTASLILGTARRIAVAVSHLRKGRIVQAARTFGSEPNYAMRRLQKARKLHRISSSEFTAKTWLELNFGWVPLLSDIYAAAEVAANAALLDVNRYVYSRGYDRQTYEADIVVDYDSHSSHHEQTLEVHANAKLVGRVDSFMPYLLSSLGLTNPLNIAWNIMPWSFVVDWVYPVSSFFGALGRTNGLTFIDGYEAVLRKQKHLQTPQNGSTKRFDGTMHQTDWEEVYNRVVRGNWPSASPPTLDVSKMLNAWKVTTSAALLKSTFGR